MKIRDWVGLLRDDVWNLKKKSGYKYEENERKIQ